MGVITRHLMEPNKYASWTLLLGLWAPAFTWMLVINVCMLYLSLILPPLNNPPPPHTHTHTPLPHSHTLSTLTQPHTHTPRTQWKVRRVLAYSLHELARILGPEHTCTDLFSVFQEYCTKDIDDVKIGAVSHLTEFFEVGACQFLTVPNTVAFTVNRLSGNAIHGPLSVAKHESTFNHKDDIGKFLKPHSLRGA